MEREKQIEFVESAEARAAGYLRSWMANPSYKASLMRFTHRDGDKKKVAIG